MSRIAHESVLNTALKRPSICMYYATSTLATQSTVGLKLTASLRLRYISIRGQ
jgi:hypothetical protein